MLDNGLGRFRIFCFLFFFLIRFTFIFHGCTNDRHTKMCYAQNQNNLHTTKMVGATKNDETTGQSMEQRVRKRVRERSICVGMFYLLCDVLSVFAFINSQENSQSGELFLLFPLLVLVTFLFFFFLPPIFAYFIVFLFCRFHTVRMNFKRFSSIYRLVVFLFGCRVLFCSWTSFYFMISLSMWNTGIIDIVQVERKPKEGMQKVWNKIWRLI